MKSLIYSTLFLVCFAHNAAFAALSVQTRFSQPRVALGNPVQYIVEITASDTAGQPKLKPITSLPIPNQSGLKLRNGRNSSSSQSRIVNGKAEYRITQTAIIDVVPPTTGTFTIPAYRIEIDGQTLTAQAATLEVVKNPADAAPTIAELAFLELDAPDKLLLGQSTPLQLNLYIADEVRVSRIGNFISQADGFSIIQNPNEYSENKILRNGREYRVLTWEMEATALTAGPQALDFELEVSARVRGSSRSSSRSPFGGSLFDDFFEPTQRFPLYSQQIIEVMPLPKEDQPDGFDGAIGTFSMEVFTDLQETQTGEPIMYSIRLAGLGNFNRIQAPKLSDSSDWKLYSPQAVMEESNQNGSTTTKRFDYVLTPLRAGQLKTPAVEFSYYDLKSKAYVTLKSPPIPITVKPSDRSFTPPVTVANNENQEEHRGLELSRSLTREEALMTLDYQPQKKTPLDQTHPYQSKAFLALQAALFLLLTTTAILLRRRVLRNEDPKKVLAQTARKASKKARKEALSATTATEYYQAALSAVRHAATARTGEDQSNATYNQLRALIADPEKNQPAMDALKQLCRGADALSFSGKQQDNDLESLRPLLDLLLHCL
ncbi:MAG: BatD family protein [Coraliomargaritaceae bacterium]